ncbi:MAG: class I SAM-dependent DNA methyltransferase [Verrucomicrobiota bacterium]|nr:class I SAM-dependent DNA methyltransferase [Verrucomicrobiota bacterium]
MTRRAKRTFLFHLLEAFSHDANTLPEGSTFEYRVRFPGQKTKFADFVWPGRVLIEMKSRGEKLSRHYQQTFDYWLNLVPHRPPFVALCNFDEFWIYDFNTQLHEPLDRVPLKDFLSRHAALNFLYPRKVTPLFGNNWVEVTREAARDVANVFNSLVARGESRETARRFVLQCVVAMFAEDIGLLPDNLFTSLLDECRKADNPMAASYDLIGNLFRQMNDSSPARGGRYAGVDYFNGGLFAKVEPLELQPAAIGLLFEAAKENWSKVQPVIFGTLFEGSLGAEERHALGAHFTYEADIQKIVRPTIVRPWEERIAAAKNTAEMLELLRQLRAFRVLDPACGSGNFLFVAYRAMRELEQNLLLKLFAQDKRQFEKVGTASGISPKQFFGLDVNENAVETAKVTLMLARRLASHSAHEFWDAHADVLSGDVRQQAFQPEKDLPLDNLDDNIRCADALFTPWPECDAIIGNPPFLDARQVTMIHGADYTKRMRAAFPDVPGRADFCVHWFRKAHEVLKPGCRAGLVGTNTIRQNYSREGGLDYIVKHGGTIIEAVSSQPWSGESAVHVSIVNWTKGNSEERKMLFRLSGEDREGPWEKEPVQRINSSLSFVTDVAAAVPLKVNQNPKLCYEGQQPGHDGFRLEAQERDRLVSKDPKCAEVIFQYLNGDELLSGDGKHLPRSIIDFGSRLMDEAARYKAAFEQVKKLVLPDWRADAEAERKKTCKEKGEHQNRLQTWWQIKRPRQQMLTAINPLSRYIVCARVTKRPIFEFLSSSIRPDSSLTVFAFADDYSFGILQSGIHWAWFTAKCSTLTERFRYTSDTVFDTFPWPQFEMGSATVPVAESGVAPDSSSAPTSAAKKSVAQSFRRDAENRRRDAHAPQTKDSLDKIRPVAEAALALRQLRREIMDANGWSLRELYKSLETPGENRLRDAHAALDAAVRRAYGMKPDEDILAFLLKLNLELAAKESKGEPITPPGLPKFYHDPQKLVTADCIKPAGL